MKPHIKLVDGTYQCSGYGVTAFGRTMKEAYEVWRGATFVMGALEAA